MEFVSQGLFSVEEGKVESNPKVYIEARRFFELTTSFNFLVRNYAKAEESFGILAFFYENVGEKLPPSELEGKVLTLRLVHLYAQGDYAEFYAALAGVPSKLRETADFKHLDEFVYFTEIGSFRNAVAAIEKISLVHKGLLSEMEDTLREELVYQNMQNDRLVLPGLRLGRRPQSVWSETGG